MKKYFLQVVLAALVATTPVNAWNNELSALAIGGLTIVGLAGALSVPDYLKQKDLDSYKNQFAEISQTITEFSKKYVTEQEFIAFHHNVKELEQKLSKLIDAKNISVERYFDEMQKDLLVLIQASAQAKAQAVTYSQKQEYQYLAHASASQAQEIENLTKEIQKWQQIALKQKKFLELHELVNKKLNHKYDVELQLYNKYGSKQSPEYFNQLIILARLKSPQALFPLLRYVKNIETDVKQLKNHLPTQVNASGNSFEYQTHQSGIHLYSALHLAYQTTTSSDRYSQELSEQNTQEERQRLTIAKEKEAAALERDSKARLLEAKNRDAQLQLEFLGIPEMKREISQLKNQVLASARVIEEQRTEKQLLTQQNKTLDNQLVSAIKKINEAYTLLSRAEEKIENPDLNPESDEYKEQLLNLIKAAKEKLG